MNAIILSAIWGVVMMFGGVFIRKTSAVKYWAIAGMLILLVANTAEFFGHSIFNIETHGMFSV